MVLQRAIVPYMAYMTTLALHGVYTRVGNRPIRDQEFQIEHHMFEVMSSCDDRFDWNISVIEVLMVISG